MHMGTFQFCWINELQLYYRIFVVYILTGVLVFRSRMEARSDQNNALIVRIQDFI